MAAIKEGFMKVVDYVMDTFGIEGNGPFKEMDEDTEGYEEYEQEGNALRQPEPIYTPVMEKRQENKILNHPSINRGGNEVVIVEPRSFDDAVTIVDHLKDRKIIMLNLHLLDKGQSQRTIDFVCGAAHALGGKPKQVGDLVFVFAPSNVTLSADAIPQQNKFEDSVWGTALR